VVNETTTVLSSGEKASALNAMTLTGRARRGITLLPVEFRFCDAE